MQDEKLLDQVQRPLTIDGAAMAARIEQLTHIVTELSAKLEKNTLAIQSLSAFSSMAGIIPPVPGQVPVEVLPTENDMLPVYTIENMEKLDEKLATDETFRSNLVRIYFFLIFLWLNFFIMFLNLYLKNCEFTFQAYFCFRTLFNFKLEIFFNFKMKEF